MASAKLDLGLGDFKAWLLALPRTLAKESDPIVQTRAEAARDRVARAYPVVTGHLRGSVRTEKLRTSDPAIVQTQVISGAEYAGNFEFGTRYTRPRPTFVPTTQAERRQMVTEVVDVVKAQGFDVTGDQS